MVWWLLGGLERFGLGGEVEGVMWFGDVVVWWSGNMTSLLSGLNKRNLG